MGVDVRIDAIDADHSRVLISELYDELNVRYGDGPDQDGSYLTEITPTVASAPLGTFVTAWLDGELVGCGALRPGSQPGTVEVKRMYVRSTARGHGISRTLLAALEDQASVLGYERLELETGLKQPEAIALYESSGWERITDYGPFAGHPRTRCYGKPVEPVVNQRERGA